VRGRGVWERERAWVSGGGGTGAEIGRQGPERGERADHAAHGRLQKLSVFPPHRVIACCNAFANRSAKGYDMLRKIGKSLL
jgi:hypothetical protein